MNREEIEAAINRLVVSRHTFEVDAVLTEIRNPEERAVVVAAALARTLAAGKEQGAKSEKERLRARLGL